MRQLHTGHFLRNNHEARLAEVKHIKRKGVGREVRVVIGLGVGQVMSGFENLFSGLRLFL